jgi:hypothetical protein
MDPNELNEVMANDPYDLTGKMLNELDCEYKNAYEVGFSDEQRKLAKHRLIQEGYEVCRIDDCFKRSDKWDHKTYDFLSARGDVHVVADCEPTEAMQITLTDDCPSRLIRIELIRPTHLGPTNGVVILAVKGMLLDNKSVKWYPPRNLGDCEPFLKISTDLQGNIDDYYKLAKIQASFHQGDWRLKTDEILDNYKRNNYYRK